MNPATEEEETKEGLTHTMRSDRKTIAYQQCVKPPSDDTFRWILQRNADQKDIQQDWSKNKERISVTMTIKNFHRAKHSDVWE